LVEALFALTKLAIAMTILIFAWENRLSVGTYLSQWLQSTTHFEFLGLTLERQLSAQQKIDELATKPGSPQINISVARGAIVRASRNAPAVSGARILWVDQHSQNNDLETAIFNDMGIEVRRVISTDEALQTLNRFSADLIISNINRPDDRRAPLINCQAHYYQVPASIHDSLDHLNSTILTGNSEENGFSMAELISHVHPAFTDPEHPRIIYYTSVAGGFAASRCARLITNQVDVLLQNVVSALEESRWQRLDVSQSAR
jgi:CheY-like chemotaxis protein